MCSVHDRLSENMTKFKDVYSVGAWEKDGEGFDQERAGARP